MSDHLNAALCFFFWRVYDELFVPIYPERYDFLHIMNHHSNNLKSKHIV